MTTKQKNNTKSTTKDTKDKVKKTSQKISTKSTVNNNVVKDNIVLDDIIPNNIAIENNTVDKVDKQLEVHVFYGANCGPCHEALPLIQKTEEELLNEPLIIFVYNKMEDVYNENFEANTFITHNITAVPTIIVKQNQGEKCINFKRWTGMPSIAEFNERLNYFIKNTEKTNFPEVKLNE